MIKSSPPNGEIRTHVVGQLPLCYTCRTAQLLSCSDPRRAGIEVCVRATPLPFTSGCERQRGAETEGSVSLSAERVGLVVQPFLRATVMVVGCLTVLTQKHRSSEYPRVSKTPNEVEGIT